MGFFSNIIFRKAKGNAYQGRSANDRLLKQIRDISSLKNSTALTPQDALRYYEHGVLGDIISTVVDPLLQIKAPVVWDKENNKKDTHPMVDFLLEKSFNIEFNLILERIATDLMLYGISFVGISVLGNTAFGYEIYDASTASYEDGQYPAYRLKVHPYDTPIVFQKESGHKFISRPYTAPLRNDATDNISNRIELCIIRNHLKSTLMPSIPCQKIGLELKYLEALGIKQISQITGVSLDFVISPKQGFEDLTQVSLFREQFLANKEGVNAETIYFAPREVDVKNISQSNREGEFLESAKEVLKKCYNWAKIPVSLKTSEASTYDNIHQAKFMLITDACIPLASRIFRALQSSLVEFFPLKGRLYFEDIDIPSLQDKRTKEVIEIYNAGIITLVEAREHLGYNIDNADELVEGQFSNNVGRQYNLPSLELEDTHGNDVTANKGI